MRVQGKSDIYDIQISLDVNSELFKVEGGNTYYFALNQHKTKQDETYDVNEDYSQDIYAEWDYITYGTVFETKETAKDRM